MTESAAGAVDFSYLESFMAGDRRVVGEVLMVFLEQARLWEPRLAPGAGDWREVVHTIKGAGRGIGANALGDVCAQAEDQGEAMLPEVRRALAEAVAAIEVYRAEA